MNKPEEVDVYRRLEGVEGAGIDDVDNDIEYILLSRVLFLGRTRAETAKEVLVGHGEGDCGFVVDGELLDELGADAAIADGCVREK